MRKRTKRYLVEDTYNSTISLSISLLEVMHLRVWKFLFVQILRKSRCHIIWKNYVLYWDFDSKVWIGDFFPLLHSLTRIKHHKTNFHINQCRKYKYSSTCYDFVVVVVVDFSINTQHVKTKWCLQAAQDSAASFFLASFSFVHSYVVLHMSSLNTRLFVVCLRPQSSGLLLQRLQFLGLWRGGGLEM